MIFSLYDWKTTIQKKKGMTFFRMKGPIVALHVAVIISRAVSHRF